MNVRTTILAFMVLALAQAVDSQENSPVLRVGESQRYCESAKQCTLVYARCDSCGCGVALNESFAAAHKLNHDALCAGYEGAHCDKICPPAKPMCVLGLCVMQQGSVGYAPTRQ